MLAKDWVEVKIDVDRMANGKAVAEKLQQGERAGMPWLAIFDATGKRLVTSVGPKGNCGCPMTVEEADWFFEMLQRTRNRLGDEDLAGMRKLHDAFAADYRARRAGR